MVKHRTGDDGWNVSLKLDVEWRVPGREMGKRVVERMVALVLLLSLIEDRFGSDEN